MEPSQGNLVRSRDPAAIASMFDRISPSYDRVNRIMTLGRDVRWRQLAIAEARVGPGGVVLDVATGTGDMARELGRRVGPDGSVLGIDIAGEMLAIARDKTPAAWVSFEQRDVMELEFTERFDAATVSFGLRNFADRLGGVNAMCKSLKPGGRFVVLELVPSHGRLRPLIDFYQNRVIPLVGGLVSGDRQAYRYLPQSVAAATTTVEIEDMLRQAAMTDVRSRELNFGTVAIVSGSKPVTQMLIDIPRVGP